MAQSSIAAQPTAPSSEPKVTLAEYRNVGILLTAFTALLAYFARLGGEPVASASLVLGPVIALAALVAVIALLMVAIRNLATMLGQASAHYYATYTGPAPADWIERPARTFDNLMQLPTLFYVVCTLMLVTGQLDRAQLAYAWLFVALRGLHALVYITLNLVPYRFATWLMGLVTLIVLWTRFALQAWPGF